MKKLFAAFAMAMCLVFVGCSAGSPSKLDAENNEYCMSKEHVKRVVGALSIIDDADTETVGTIVAEQYATIADSVVSVYAEEGIVKWIINIKTDNTAQELAAFVAYYARMYIGEYVDKEIESGCKDFVMVMSDYDGDVIAVWLAYKNADGITHDMNIVDADVLEAVDEVLEDTDKWALKENVRYIN